jgi:hypothetical protein
MGVIFTLNYEGKGQKKAQFYSKTPEKAKKRITAPKKAGHTDRWRA